MNGYYLFGLIIALMLFIVTMIMVPIQYRYIKRVEEERKEDTYERMSAQEQFLHYNAQSNPLFLPANIIAYIIYKSINK
ncbi:DUF3949 domain-containing protein [Rossellomorea aquimaris]|uniref:DUF3949 domain-containing protein n=1 Tax=Rossellomorea aquimaris TaxID=189382 RepID=UPI0007D0A8E2|nr:DUF3949 domain-containing protein [Rossellomorea aquimaris]